MKQFFVLLLLFSFDAFGTEDRVLILIKDSREVVLSKLAELPSTRLKFAVSGDVLAISTTGEKKPKHDELASYGEVQTGGYIQIDRDQNDQILSIAVDNFSGRLCPLYVSLSVVFPFLEKVLNEHTKFTMLNRSNTKKCN